MGLNNSEQQCTTSGSMLAESTEVVLVLKIVDCNSNPKFDTTDQKVGGSNPSARTTKPLKYWGFSKGPSTENWSRIATGI